MDVPDINGRPLRGRPMRPSSRRRTELRDEKGESPFPGLPDALSARAVAWLDRIATYGGPHAKKPSPNTVSSYRSAIATFSKWLSTSGRSPASATDIDGPTAKDFIDCLVDDGYKPKSISVKRAALKSFWDHLVSCGEASLNVFSHIDVPVPNPGVPKPFSDDEDFAIIRELFNAGEWYPALLIMRFAGLRLTETLKLSPDDVGWSENGEILRIRVLHAKGGKERWAVMAPYDDHAADKWKIPPHFYQTVVWNAVKRRAGNEKLFEHGKGGLFSTYHTMIKKKLLPEGFHPHRLRHTFATWLVKKGYKEDIVSKLLGHTSVRTTRIYAAERPEDLERDFLNERGFKG